MKGWIALDKDMVDDPRMVEAALALRERYVSVTHAASGNPENLEGSATFRFFSNAVLGALVTLWRYAHDHIRNDNTLPLRYAAIDALVGLDGFAETMPDCWIVELDDGTVQLPGYVEKNGLIAKRKRIASNRERQARWRSKHSKGQVGGNGTHNAPRNAPVTRYADVTKCVDQDQDQDSKKKTLRSSSSGDLSPSLSGGSGGDQDVLKKREENRKKVDALVADLAAAKRWA